ncbi:MAG: LamG domain-containing protein, partial [Oligosphaeraceae bacterium]|nr:LamG domain-containing protein [Oligosphaeraceae bacterium]
GWKVLFEYNRKDEAFSSVFSDGKYFKDTSFWQDLLFSTFAPPPCQLAAATGEVVLTEQQHSNGSGTKVTFRPALESSSPIYVKHFTAQILDADGNNLSQPLPLIADTYLPVCWKAGLPISTQLEVTQPGVVIAMEAVYLENGQEKHFRQERACAYITLAGENTPTGEATLRTPFNLDFQDTLAQKEGALSLQFKPDWEGNAVFYAGVTRKTLFHCGPPLAGETLYWKNVMVLSYDRSTRHFYLHINNGSSTIGVHANADNWDEQSFISVAASWDLTGAQPQLALYLEGQKASSEPTAWGQPISGSFPPQGLPFPFSFGATNAGYQHADGAIGAVRAWKSPAAFVSQAPPDYP